MDKPLSRPMACLAKFCVVIFSTLMITTTYATSVLPTTRNTKKAPDREAIRQALFQAGKQKAMVCAACHGADGNSMVAAWPKLAGQNVRYTIKQLTAFKQGANGPRNNAVMLGQVSNLSPEDMQQIAIYFADQTTTDGSTPKQYLAKGRALYRGGDMARKIPACMACHGPNGKGNNEAMFPKVAGQWADYSIQQLKDYRSASRKTGAMMLDIAKKLTDEDIIAVSHYMSGLH